MAQVRSIVWVAQADIERIQAYWSEETTRWCRDWGLPAMAWQSCQAHDAQILTAALAVAEGTKTDIQLDASSVWRATAHLNKCWLKSAATSSVLAAVAEDALLELLLALEGDTPANALRTDGPGHAALAVQFKWDDTICQWWWSTEALVRLGLITCPASEELPLWTPQAVFSGLPATLGIQLGVSTLDVAALASLEEGDVLLLGARPDLSADVHLAQGGNPLAKARLGALDHQLGLQFIRS
jgi:hypothetical protein